MLKQNRGKPDSQARILVEIQKFRRKHAGDPTVDAVSVTEESPEDHPPGLAFAGGE